MQLLAIVDGGAVEIDDEAARHKGRTTGSHLADVGERTHPVASVQRTAAGIKAILPRR
jgi:hypothetical protein